jgi:hypothetical protein
LKNILIYIYIISYTLMNSSPLIFSKKDLVKPKFLDGWFSGNKTNFGSKASQLSFDTKVINLNEHRLIKPI